MNRPLEVRFIPGWLSKVIDHYGTGHAEFERIVSKHDVRLYKLANNLLRTKLNQLDITDFVMPDAEISESFSEDDAQFALFGQNRDERKVPEWEMTRFQILTDKHEGILIVECDDAEPSDLLVELLKAVALYCGKEAAYNSSSFRRYLTNVNNYIGDPDLILDQAGENRFHASMKARMAADHHQVHGNKANDVS